MTLATLPIERIALADLPFYFRAGHPMGNVYVHCGQVKRGGNEPYCYAEEKQCAGHVCRVLAPGRVIDRCCVIRDDGTVWQIHLSNFVDVTRLELQKEPVDSKTAAIFKSEEEQV
jgi:hypothetical protein